MARRRFSVGISWNDRGIEDADIVTVYAEDAGKAKRRARQRWKRTIGAELPHCRVTEAWIFLPVKLRPAWLRGVT